MPPEARAIRGVDDSKVLDAPEREKLAKRILERALAVGIGAASVREIERINIYHASVLAIRRAKLYYLRHLTGKATRIKERKAKVSVPQTGTPATE